MPQAETKVVYLLVGPRGAGKSFYANRLLLNQPELKLISRDEILMQLFGSISQDPYSGAHEYALEHMYDLLHSELQAGPITKIVLDCWTDSHERWKLVLKLRELGATRVVALYFTTPRNVVKSWFWQKPEIKKWEPKSHADELLKDYIDDSPSRAFDAFHEGAAQRINSDGFDEVIRVDPRKKLMLLI